MLLKTNTMIQNSQIVHYEKCYRPQKDTASSPTAVVPDIVRNRNMQELGSGQVA